MFQLNDRFAPFPEAAGWSAPQLRILVGFKAHLEDKFSAMSADRSVRIVAVSPATTAGNGGFMMATVIVQERLPEPERAK